MCLICCLNKNLTILIRHYVTFKKQCTGVLTVAIWKHSGVYKDKISDEMTLQSRYSSGSHH